MLEVFVSFDDIEIFYKLNIWGNKVIIVKFISYKVKMNFYRVRIKFKYVKLVDFFFDFFYVMKV